MVSVVKYSFYEFSLFLFCNRGSLQPGVLEPNVLLHQNAGIIFDITIADLFLFFLYLTMILCLLACFVNNVFICSWRIFYNILIVFNPSPQLLQIFPQLFNFIFSLVCCVCLFVCLSVFCFHRFLFLPSPSSLCCLTTSGCGTCLRVCYNYIEETRLSLFQQESNVNSYSRRRKAHGM